MRDNLIFCALPCILRLFLIPPLGWWSNRLNSISAWILPQPEKTQTGGLYQSSHGLIGSRCWVLPGIGIYCH